MLLTVLVTFYPEFQNDALLVGAFETLARQISNLVFKINNNGEYSAFSSQMFTCMLHVFYGNMDLRSQMVVKVTRRQIC